MKNNHEHLVESIDLNLDFRQAWGFFEGVGCIFVLENVRDSKDSFWWVVLIAIVMTVWYVVGKSLSNEYKILLDHGLEEP